MRRRAFITLIGGTAAAWPLAARAQQSGKPVVGFLSGLSAESFTGEIQPYVAAFRAGLGASGYNDRDNVAIEYRWAENQPDRLPALAADLVRSEVSVIVTAGGTAPALAAKAASSTIPVVFTAGTDPVKIGLVDSLNRPGANVTGVTFLANVLAAKRLELVSELVPNESVIAFLLNPNNPNAAIETNDFEAGARTIGKQPPRCFCGPVPSARSRRCSPSSRERVSKRSRPRVTVFSIPGAGKSCVWRHATVCRRLTPTASLLSTEA